jgi:4-amino-4-deoxy-L-arabinose transferase-like glycosyltransferase
VGIAAVCPFLPCYAASLLTEVPTTFLLTAALVATVSAFRRGDWWAWWGTGALTGIATLFRAESGLLAPVIGVALLIRYRARSQWRHLGRASLIYGAGLGLALVPWTLRNVVTLHEFQPLAPRYANLPNEYVPLGYCRWVRTWLVRYRDSTEGFWKLDEQPISIARLPDSAFDSPEERARVATLLERYNQTSTMTPEVDRGFAEIAAERIARHPWRYYFTAPLRKAFTLWFTPRVEILPYSGDLWPPRQRLEEDWQDFLVTVSFGGTNLLLLALAGWGLLAWRRQLAFADLLLAWILLRTAFFTTVETPEPRYVLECYPAVFVLAALGLGAIRWRFFPAKVTS